MNNPRIVGTESYLVGESCAAPRVPRTLSGAER
jgi:hypothetical protein